MAKSLIMSGCLLLAISLFASSPRSPSYAEYQSLLDLKESTKNATYWCVDEESNAIRYKALRVLYKEDQILEECNNVRNRIRKSAYNYLSVIGFK